MAMIGRGCFGNPWLFTGAKAAIEGREIPPLPPLAQRCDTAVRQFELARQNKTIILEIDPLVDDASVRRKGFYERCGYVANAFAHVHPPYQAANRGHELIVMSYPHAISQSEFDSFTLDLGEKVMKYSEGKRNA